MSTSTTEKGKASTRENTTTPEDGPVVLHARTTTDEHTYVACGSDAEAQDLAREIQTNSPGKYEFNSLPLTPVATLQADNPPPVEDEEA